MIPCVLEHVALVDGHQRDRLGDVERGASAQSDDRIGTMLAEGGDAVGDLAFDRIAPDVGIHGDVEPMQVGDELRKQRQRGDAAVGDDQRALQALRGQVLGDELARARAEVNGRREGKSVDGHRAADPILLAASPIRTKRSSRMSLGHCATLTSGRITHVSVRR